MTLRPAAPDDVPAVQALEKALFGADAWSGPLVESELLGRDRLALVADEEDEVTGYVVLMMLGEVADVNRIAVTSGRQRQGLASALLAAAIAQARQRGVQRLVLEVADRNGAAIAFYERCGFAEIARRPRYYRDGSAAVVMERTLG